MGANLHVHAPPHAPFYPPGTPAVHFPLYPGGQRDRSPVHWPGIWFISHAFMKTGRARFLLPVRPAAAEAWYEAAFTACGFHLDGSHPRGGNPPQPWAAIFESGAADRGTMLALQGVGMHETRAFYFGWLVTPPPRLPASLLPTDIASVRVSFRPASDQPDSRTLTITNPADIARLVTAYNTLDRYASLRICPSRNNEATMRFKRSNGAAITVTLDGCVGVWIGRSGTLPTLEDRPGGVWDTLTNMVQNTGDTTNPRR